MDLRARVHGIFEGDPFLALLENDVSGSDCHIVFFSHSLSVLADPRPSRLIRGGFSYSFLHKIPPDSPTPCFVFWLLICSHLHHWKGRKLCSRKLVLWDIGGTGRNALPLRFGTHDRKDLLHVSFHY